MVIESKRFFSVAAADNLIIIKANKLWRDTFPNAITVTDVIHPDHYDFIPDESQCDPSKPIDVSLNVIVGAD